MTCGFWAGVVATIVTHPPDVIKTKMQLQPETFPTMLSTAKHIVTNRGVKGLFAGMVIRLIRRPLMAAITWTIYEEIKIRS